jgi:FtsP/CotA-like multicopper oxidase with cupredoxin domain
MVRIGSMANPGSWWTDRRELMAGLGAAVLAPALPAAASRARRLQARADVVALRPGAPGTPVWSLGGPDIRFKRGDVAEIAFGNDLPVPAVLNWRGIDGAQATEPLLARASLSPGTMDTFRVPLRHAGTLLCDPALLCDGAARPTRGLPVIVDESEPVAVDRDQVLLIEDWRLRSDGSAIAPGSDPADTMPVYTVNGLRTPDITARGHERLRLRFINGCQRSVIAVKIEGHEVRIMALDGQPAEPFLARNGAFVLAPGSRADTFIDAPGAAGFISSILLHDGREAHPIARLVTSMEPPLRDAELPAASALPSNDLPNQLDLRNALRADLTLGVAEAGWVAPANFAATALPAFRVKAGRTAVLALTNPAAVATVFHLHGHHFRLLDRLDDGWKPFWLDTLAIESGQTQHIAFAAEYGGRWLLEATATGWAAPRLVRWYSVE